MLHKAISPGGQHVRRCIWLKKKGCPQTCHMNIIHSYTYIHKRIRAKMQSQTRPRRGRPLHAACGEWCEDVVTTPAGSHRCEGSASPKPASKQIRGLCPAAGISANVNAEAPGLLVWITTQSNNASAVGAAVSI